LERRLSQLAATEIAGEHNFVRTDRLRQSILKRAFEGKLVPQDPNDEPASALLQRIRTEKIDRSADGARSRHTVEAPASEHQ
jgi:type I restriction enzyme S subunit